MKRIVEPSVVKSHVFHGTNGVAVICAHVFMEVVGIVGCYNEPDEWSYGRSEILIDEPSFAMATAGDSQLVIDLGTDEAYVKTLAAASMVLKEFETMVWVELDVLAEA